MVIKKLLNNVVLASDFAQQWCTLIIIIIVIF